MAAFQNVKGRSQRPKTKDQKPKTTSETQHPSSYAHPFHLAGQDEG